MNTDLQKYLDAFGGLTSLAYLMSAFALAFVIKILFTKLRSVLTLFNHKKRHLNWLLELVNVLEKPLYIYTWVWALSLCMQAFLVHSKSPIAELIPQIRFTILIVILMSTLLKFINKMEDGLYSAVKYKQLKLNKLSVDILIKLVRVVSYIAAALLIMKAFGVDTSALLAVGGISSVVFGLASRDILASFFATIMIYLNKPFVLGEDIKLENKDERGIVEKIYWRMTAVRTLDKRLLFIPNYKFVSNTVENCSRVSHKLFVERLRIAYIDKELIIILLKQIKGLLERTEGIEPLYDTKVEIISISQDMIEIEIKALCIYVAPSEFIKFKNALLLDIVQIARDNGINLASYYKVASLTQ